MTLASAQHDLDDLDAMEGARIVEQRAQAAAPKRSGRLANSVRAQDIGQGIVVVASSLVYAPVIHGGWPAHHITAQPFLTDALTNSQPLVVADLTKQAQTALGKVHGA
jgi:hypothetical protein